MSRWTYLKNDYSHFELEQNHEGFLFFHIEIYKWSKTVYKSLIKDMLDMFESLKEDGIKILFAIIDNEKLGRFAEMFNWKYINTLPNGNELYAAEVS